MPTPRTAIAAAMLALAAATSPALAVGIDDATDDFIASFTGSKTGGIDILATSVTYDGTSFNFTATMADKTTTAANPRYVLGFDRGGGVATFAAVGLTNVLFDTVVAWGADGKATINGVANAATVAGMGTDTMTLSFLASLLPSTGFAVQNYTWNFWTRDQSQTGTAALADFAPNNANLGVVPAPATLALAALAFAALGLGRRRQRA